MTASSARPPLLRPPLLEYEVPERDPRIPLRHVPSRPRSGFVVANVRQPG
ncbi:hypothetical protein IQ279_22100 [Streptomyces verrucosisporus]|nr:hypothetical protein [Streptomyces verrucosisporus]MBN3932284.1 hypothetical protein [Streptomyces verrucosisporus]